MMVRLVQCPVPLPWPLCFRWSLWPSCLQTRFRLTATLSLSLSLSLFLSLSLSLFTCTLSMRIQLATGFSVNLAPFLFWREQASERREKSTHSVACTSLPAVHFNTENSRKTNLTAFFPLIIKLSFLLLLILLIWFFLFKERNNLAFATARKNI